MKHNNKKNGWVMIGEEMWAHGTKEKGRLFGGKEGL